jgi:hypothetical protein
MNNLSRKLSNSLSAILLVLLLSAQTSLAVAQEAESDKNDSSKNECKQCIKYTGWRGDLDFGLGYVTDDSLRFGDYRGLDEKGFYAAVDGDLHFRNLDGRYFDMYARDLGYDSRQLEMRGGNQGFYELRFGWAEIPRYRGYGTQTPFIGAGSDTLTLPADWVPANTTGGMTALNSSLVPEPLKTQRKTLDAGVTLKFARNWSVRADYQRQKKAWHGQGNVRRSSLDLSGPTLTMASPHSPGRIHFPRPPSTRLFEPLLSPTMSSTSSTCLLHLRSRSGFACRDRR